MLNCLYTQDVLWQMSAAERMAMFYILDRMPKKDIAIEIGSYKGGCTRVLSQQFKKVVSIDIDHTAIAGKDAYENVDWLTGMSTDMLPVAFGTYKDVDFIIVDGDHGYDGAYKDLMLCIESNAIILVHDAAYSETARAIMDFKELNAETHIVDIKFVPGEPFGEGLIGGFAIIYRKMKITDV
jgi:predicted O-methyltransferase YrrM